MNGKFSYFLLKIKSKKIKKQKNYKFVEKKKLKKLIFL